ncbi:MAG: hypothetical protein KAI99_10350, partial [Cyclobacteriaceae bacterium]|nr:hypothetical protein [Cyclobacteriaceae bacterium]
NLILCKLETATNTKPNFLDQSLENALQEHPYHPLSGLEVNPLKVKKALISIVEITMPPTFTEFKFNVHDWKCVH